MEKGSVISLTVSLLLSVALTAAMIMNRSEDDNPRRESRAVENTVLICVIAPLIAAGVFCISLLLRGKYTNPNNDLSGGSLAQGFLYLAWIALAGAAIYFYAKGSSDAERHFRDADRHFQDAEKVLNN